MAISEVPESTPEEEEDQEEKGFVPPENSKWYVIHTYSGYEKKVNRPGVVNRLPGAGPMGRAVARFASGVDVVDLATVHLCVLLATSGH